MGVTLVHPQEKPAPLPERYGTGQVMLLSLAGAVRGIVFKVRDFDPAKHPRGYKGLFIETPDKIEVRHTSPGDVFATKSGKIFRVEGHGQKGAKVSSVDPDTGEVLAKGTVVAHNIQVARIVGGKGIGTSHPISELDPGTYVQHPKSGKRFVIHKHGNWTTVFPVDSQGERSGKHTVLPPTTEMVVTAKQQGGQVTPQIAQQVHQAQAAQVAAPAPTSTNPLGVKEGNNVIGKNTGTVYEVKKVDAQGVWVEDSNGSLELIDPANYEKHIVEVMPEGLKRPPRPYADNVGKDTSVTIREVITGSGYVGNSLKFRTSFEIVRNPTGDVLGGSNKIGDARRQARNAGEAHEAIHEQRVLQPELPEVGDLVMTASNMVGKIESVEKMQSWYGSGHYWRVRLEGQVRTYTVNQSQTGSNLYVIPDVAKAEDALRNNGDLGFGESLGEARPIGRSGMELLWKQVSQADPKTTRAARPALYIDALRHDFDPSELIGKTKGEALSTLRKLGYGEITPREPNMTKYVNANGKRLHIHNKGGVVTAIDEIQRQATRGGGKGFHGQLQAVLDSGGDVRTLDPSQSPYPEERTSHTRQILYDMALGKQNGVEKLFQTSSSTVKVKSDTAYSTEIQQDTAWMGVHGPAAQKANVTDPGVNVPISADVMNTHWGVPTSAGVNAHLLAPNEDVTTAAIATGERNGIAAAMKAAGATDHEEASHLLGDAWAEWKTGDTAAFDSITSDPATRDYLVNTMTEIAPRGKRQWDFRQTEIDRRADALFHQAITGETATRRKAEGTVAVAPGGSNTFELPLWDDVDMKDQDLYEVESLVQNAPLNSQTPMFASGGIVRDGVLYARMDHGKHVLNARVPLDFDSQAATRLSGAQRTTNSKHPSPSGSSFNRTGAGHMLLLDEGGGKRIEYVPHGGGQEAPANQRGRLTLEGYTPTEAMQRLQDLGIIHEAEEQVPFSSIMRSERRYGVVSPLHSDYVSGEAPLPKIPTAIVHGMNSYNFSAVADSGGLLPITERFKVGIPLNGTIPLNDIAGGVDHVVFAAMTKNTSPYGDMNVVMKDSAYLRRDVLVTDRAFGTGRTRYPAYRNYMNGFRRQAGDANPDANIYEPLSPKARQLHIDSRTNYISAGNLSPNNNEWDLAGGVPIEDMAVIVVYSQSEARSVEAKLDQLLREGRISEKPLVTDGSISQHASR